MALLNDLGLFGRFAKLSRSQLSHMQLSEAQGNDTVLVDFRRLPVRHRYIAMVPQWDLLNVIAEVAASEANFTLLTEHEVTGVVRENNRVIGVFSRSPEGEGRLLADLVSHQKSSHAGRVVPFHTPQVSACNVTIRCGADPLSAAGF